VSGAFYIACVWWHRNGAARALPQALSPWARATPEGLRCRLTSLEVAVAWLLFFPGRASPHLFLSHCFSVARLETVVCKTTVFVSDFCYCKRPLWWNGSVVLGLIVWDSLSAFMRAHTWPLYLNFEFWSGIKKFSQSKWMILFGKNWPEKAEQVAQKSWAWSFSFYGLKFQARPNLAQNTIFSMARHVSGFAHRLRYCLEPLELIVSC
jgi:hypothetical protein